MRWPMPARLRGKVSSNNLMVTGIDRMTGDFDAGCLSSKVCRIRGNSSYSTRHPLQVYRGKRIDSEEFLLHGYTTVNLLIRRDLR